MFEKWRRERRERKLLETFAKRYPIYIASPYNAVVMKAFQKLAADLSHQNDFIAPQYSETYRQYFVKVERYKKLPASDLYGFLQILETACYSRQDVGEEGKIRVIGHLRAIEMSFDGSDETNGKGPLTSPNGTPKERPEIVAPPLRNLPDLDHYREIEGARDNAPDELSALESALRPKEGAKLAPSPPGILERIKNEVKGANMKGLREAFGEIQDAEVKDVHFAPSMLRYVLELKYRTLELFGMKWRNEVPLSAKLVRDAQRLAMADGRGFVVPDDIKLSFLSQSDIELPINIPRREDVLDSASVPILVNP